MVVDPELAPFIEPAPGDPPMVGYDEVRGDAEAWTPPSTEDSDLAILQFTSGSTSDPKGVMLPHAAVLANIDGMIEALTFDPDDDVLVSWLPLYHDMGLVGILTSSMATGADLVLAGPQTFMASPSRWVQWLSTYGGTITAGPNFSWVLAARALKRLDGLDLSRLRVALNGAEPVDPRTVANLVEAGSATGCGPVRCSRRSAWPRSRSPARSRRRCLACGPTTSISGCSRSSATPRRPPTPPPRASSGWPSSVGRSPAWRSASSIPRTARFAPEREVGELQIRGTSVTSGYYRRPDATAAAFDGDWLRTGDLGYLVDGELVLCGRIKDIIIVAGRNVFPEDVERSVAEIDGVRAGNVIAFGVEGRRSESVIVVAEARHDDLAPVRDQVAARVRSVIGMSADDVVLVAPGSLPKTSSGKLQRSLCRDRYLGKDLQPV